MIDEIIYSYFGFPKKKKKWVAIWDIREVIGPTCNPQPSKGKVDKWFNAKQFIVFLAPKIQYLTFFT